MLSKDYPISWYSVYLFEILCVNILTERYFFSRPKSKRSCKHHWSNELDIDETNKTHSHSHSLEERQWFRIDRSWHQNWVKSITVSRLNKWLDLVEHFSLGVFNEKWELILQYYSKEKHVYFYNVYQRTKILIVS